MQNTTENSLHIIAIDASFDRCDGCILGYNTPSCQKTACLPHERDDGRNVIFVYREQE